MPQSDTHLFQLRRSSPDDQLAKDLDWEHGEASTVLSQLLDFYELEGLKMPYTMDDFHRDFLLEHIHELPPEERLKGLPPEERLKGLSVEEIRAYLQALLKQSESEPVDQS